MKTPSRASRTRWLHGVLAAASLAASAALCSATAAGRAGGGARSPLALAPAPSAGRVLVAEADADCITEMDTRAGTVLRRLPLPGAPAALLALPGGAALAVAGGGAEGGLWILEAGSGRLLASLPLGHTPTALACDTAGRRLWAACRFEDGVREVALDAGAAPVSGVQRRVRTGREPVALAATPDGGTLVVAHLLPEGRADTGDVSAEVVLLATDTLQPRAVVRLPNGSTGVRGVALSPDGRWAYVTHILGRYQSPTTQLERGWMNTNALSLIDVREGRRRATVLLDSVEQGAANPWGVACSGDGRWLAVAHSGSHEISVIDRNQLHQRLEAAGTQSDPLDDLAFMAGVQRRRRIAGLGPRGLLVADGKAYAACYYSDRITEVTLAITGDGAVRELPLGPEPELTEARLGEIAFHDASRCFQRWQSCASCHPDARVDALNWDLMNDGLGNPKNTKSMFGSHATPPAMWLGVRKEAEVAVRSGFKHIQFALVDEATARAVDRYLAGIAPVPSPHLEGGRPGAAARRGERHFQSLGCAACHPAPLYTDLRSHDIGTTRGMDSGKPVDVPSLLEGWRTAPYLHDGSAATMREVLTTRNPDGRHGEVKWLTTAELDDLIAFLLSL